MASKYYVTMTMDQFQQWDQHVKQSKEKGKKWVFPEEFLKKTPELQTHFEANNKPTNNSLPMSQDHPDQEPDRE